jgi:hypothetical protein
MTPTPSIPTALQVGEYNRAFRYSKRRETRKPDGSVRQRAGSLTYLYMQTRTPVFCNLTTGCPAPTATWRWDGGRVRHYITIHPDFPKHFFDEAGNTPKRRIELTKSVLAHEACHGLYTSRSADIPRTCASQKIPFRLVNLMEDARIEFKYVKDRGKDERFRWRLFEDKMRQPGDEITSPIDWLYTMKTREPVLFKSLTSVMAAYKWGGPENISLPSVSYPHPLKAMEGRTVMFRWLICTFYTHIVAAPTTEDVIPLARYWTDIFGRESASDLPPIIIDTVPGDLGGTPDPMDGSGGESSDADRSTREVDHSAVTSRDESDAHAGGRAMVMPEKVMHHNTDQFVRQPPRPGFVPLLRYCAHR